MRWKGNRRPEYDEVRIVKKFALVPTRVSDGTVVWLERYLVRQQYIEGTINDFWFTMGTYLPGSNPPQRDELTFGV